MSMLEKIFRLSENQTNLRTEAIADLTTFLTMAYIIFLQPAIMSGALYGNSTVTCYIESAAGVEQGGRTGLVGIIVAALFLLALFFSPLVQMIGSYAPITAPALLIVGFMMIQNIAKIAWTDYSEAIPSFITAIGIPLAYSIADGLAIGFIIYPLIKIISGRGRELKWPVVAISGVLLLYFIFVRE